MGQTESVAFRKPFTSLAATYMYHMNMPQMSPSPTAPLHELISVQVDIIGDVPASPCQTIAEARRAAAWAKRTTTRIIKASVLFFERAYARHKKKSMPQKLGGRRMLVNASAKDPYLIRQTYPLKASVKTSNILVHSTSPACRKSPNRVMYVL